MIRPDLLQIMCCPETRQRLAVAEASLVERLNQQIRAGQLRDRSGELIREEIEGGLVREDGAFLYPIRSQIPIMLIEESIPLRD